MKILLSGLLLTVATEGIAHPGGLNSEGCHNNRKTGDYHCHRAPAASRPSPLQRAFGGGGASFPNCPAARAAGAAPVRAGNPGYGQNFDRDGNDIGVQLSSSESLSNKE